MTHDPAPRRTPLYAEHVALGATMTDFGGWEMPLRYGSDLAEHRAVREAAGLFDLSHMGEIHVEGAQAGPALDRALVGTPSKIAEGRARYTMICAPDGGVLDDLIVYRLTDGEAGAHYLVVANAGNAPMVAAELGERCQRPGVSVVDRGADTALIAVQGPRAAEILLSLVPAAAESRAVDAMASYTWQEAHLAVPGGSVRALVARTGYTGEDGFELFVDADDAPAVWRTLLAGGAPLGLVPCGLSARDSLRLEAGMPLYGHELDATLTPFDAGLGRTVALGKVTADGDPVPFVGRAALAARAEMPARRALVGLRGSGRRAARAGYAVLGPDGTAVGTVTSGLPSPTLGVPIAMAYVDPAVADDGTDLSVDVRGRAEPFVVVPLPFYRRPR